MQTMAKCNLWLVAALSVCACSSQGEDSNEGNAESSPDAGPAGSAPASRTSAGSTASTATAMVPVPTKTTVSAPPEGGKVFTASTIDLASFDYEQAEYFYEGGATSYTVAGGAATDGKWQLAESTRAAFKSRLVVRLPKDRSKFNGTVIVEWLNVSGGVDADPGFMYNVDLITREGYAWVGVSAQAVGIQGGGINLGAIAGTGGPPVQPLKEFSPERYGSLAHPGDEFSYDIFSIAGAAIREPKEIDVLDGLEVKHLLAYGESQSAGRMVSYVNGVHPIAKVYDAFFIHSRGASGAGFTTGGLGLPGFGGAVELIRDDIAEKVFQFQTETDVTGALAFFPARQPDTEKLITWEVAGTAHADKYLVDFNANNPMGMVDCPNANAGPQYRIIRAALHALNSWVSDGIQPPRGEPLEADASGKSLRDQHGNAKGGVRSPDVDVPISTLSGDSTDTSGFFCFIFGSTTPFAPEKLMELYPTHEEYVQKVKASAEATFKAGFLLEPEAMGFVADAERASVPN